MITKIIRQNDTTINDNDNDDAILNGMEMWQASDCCSSIHNQLLIPFCFQSALCSINYLCSWCVTVCDAVPLKCIECQYVRWQLRLLVFPLHIIYFPHKFHSAPFPFFWQNVPIFWKVMSCFLAFCFCFVIGVRVVQT